MDDQRLARSAMIKDYYAILGVTQTATQEEIRTAYRQLVLKYHPDVSTAPDAEERFKEINEAYAMLSEPEKRKVYDIFLTMIANGMGKFAAGPQQPESQPAAQSQTASQTAAPYPNQPGPQQQPPPPGYQQQPAYQQPPNVPPQNPYANPYQAQPQSGYAPYPPNMPQQQQPYPQQPYYQQQPQPGPGYPYQAPYPQQQNPYMPNNQGPYPAPYPSQAQQPPYPAQYQQPQTGPYPGQQQQPTGYPYTQPTASSYPYQATPAPQQQPASPYGVSPTPSGYNTQPSPAPPQPPTYPPSQSNPNYYQQASGQPPKRTEKEQKKKRQQGSRYFPPTWALLLILLGFLIVVAVGISALLSMQRNRPTGGSEALTLSKLPTFVSPPVIPSDPVIQGNGVPVTAIVPENLAIGAKSISIVPVIPEEGRWPIPAEDGNVAVWVYGTVINYVIGMPYSDTTESTLAGLSSADRLTMTLSNGNQLVFGSPQAQRITAEDTTPMVQQKPGLTLVLLGGSQTNRLVVQARYLPEESPESGNEQRIEGIAFKVLESRAVEADGNNYFVIEYQTTNSSANPADPGLFDLVLEDGDGQRYTPNQAATAQGSAGALTAPIPVGNTATGSVGYKVPASLKTPLTWRVKVDPTSTNIGTFVLPYEPPPLTPAQPAVELTNAFVDPSRNVIVVEGTLRNLGETTLNVTLDSLKLSSSAGSSTLQASTPLLPWSVAGEGEQSFELQFSLPQDTDSVLLDVFGYTFEIDGL